MTMPIVSWDPSNKLWVPSPPAPNSITTEMLESNAVTLTHLAVGVVANPTTTSSSLVDLPDAVLTFTTPVTCDLLVSMHCAIGMTVATNTGLTLSFDGVDTPNAGAYAFATVPASGAAVQMAFTTILQNVAAGMHTLQGRWNSASGTSTAISTVRGLTAVELRR